MTVRLMTLADHPQLAALWEPEHMDTRYSYLEAVLERNPTTCFVVECEGRVVAAACGLYDGRRGFVQSVAVLPGERGKGYGRTVVQAAVNALKAFGTARIRLFVHADNRDVVGFYEKLGFESYDYIIYMGLAQMDGAVAAGALQG